MENQYIFFSFNIPKYTTKIILNSLFCKLWHWYVDLIILLFFFHLIQHVTVSNFLWSAYFSKFFCNSYFDWWVQIVVTYSISHFIKRNSNFSYFCTNFFWVVIILKCIHLSTLFTGLLLIHNLSCYFETVMNFNIFPTCFVLFH